MAIGPYVEGKGDVMKPLIILALLGQALLVVPVGATEPKTAPETATETAAMRAPADAGGESADIAAEPGASSDVAALGPASVGPHLAQTVDWQAQLYHRRPLVIFADSPENPDYLRQLQLIERDLAALDERNVVVVLDSDPAAQSDWRKRLRPHGFSLVLLDTDLRPVFRKPSPWDVREITRSIDRLPSRRQDVSREYPAGR